MNGYRLIRAVSDHEPAIRPTYVEVDLGAVAHNARVLGQVSGNKLFAVVKADAYGHGALPVARRLADDGGVFGFAVSLVEEGVELREGGIEEPILVMGPSQRGGERELIEHQLWPMVSSLSSLRALARVAEERLTELAVHLKLDTGMGRLGFDESGLVKALDLITEVGPLRLGGVATHFACADSDDPDDESSMTRRQLERFRGCLAAAEVDPAVMRHAANSAACLHHPDAHFEAVRPGLALYAAGPASGDDRFRTTTRLVSAITQIRTAEVGDTVSYGALWKAERASRLAVVPVGYADGLPRSLTGKAEALVGGRRAPVVGAVSMDITVLDITDFSDATIADEVVFLGRQDHAEITIGEFAERAGLSHYEVTCGISKRVPRRYR
jgi:alanine racemase